MSEIIGVVAIQGDFEKHLKALVRAGVPDSRLREVRTPEDLKRVARVIIPGGESTTVGLLMERYGLGEALRKAAGRGMPLWGTCMGMILMARTVVGRPRQFALGLLDVEVERNAFGAQVHSFEVALAFKGLKEPVTGVFIRAPAVAKLGKGVEPLAEVEGRIVAVRQGRLLGTSFHPELTDDPRLHELFLKL